MQLSRIRTRVRDNSGWSSTNDRTTERIDEAINYIYTRRIPHEINWHGLQDWIYFDLVDGTSSYAIATTAKDAAGGAVLGTRVRNIIPPVILVVDANNAAKINFTRDYVGFWEEYPPYTNEEEGQPTTVLEQKETLFPRPIPDDSYTLRVMADLRPAELSGASDEPVEDWEEMIIAGATAVLLEDDEDNDAGYWWTIYADRKADEVGNQNSGPQARVKAHW
jgi:hypothetical protein